MPKITTPFSTYSEGSSNKDDLRVKTDKEKANQGIALCVDLNLLIIHRQFRVSLPLPRGAFKFGDIISGINQQVSTIIWQSTTD